MANVIASDVAGSNGAQTFRTGPHGVCECTQGPKNSYWYVLDSKPQATFLLIAPFSPKSQRASTAIALQVVPTSPTAVHVEVNFSRYQRCYKVTTTPQAGETSVSHISGTWRGFQPRVARTCLLGAVGHPPKHKAT